MKKLLFGLLTFAATTSAALGADMGSAAGPLTAVPALSGDLAVYAGFLSLNDYTAGGSDADASLLGAAGRINVWLTPTISAQLDVNGERLGSTDPSIGAYTTGNVAGHLSFRGDNVLVGGFASFGGQRDWWNGSFATVGAEAQASFGQAQIYGQVGATRSLTIDPGYDISALYVRGEARFFLTPNAMIAANAGYVRESYMTDDVVQAITWGADVEYKINNAPVSLFASYQGSNEAEPDSSESFTNHSVLAGFKISFGSATLQAASKTGATLRDYNPLTGVAPLRVNDWE